MKKYLPLYIGLTLAVASHAFAGEDLCKKAAVAKAQESVTSLLIEEGFMPEFSDTQVDGPSFDAAPGAASSARHYAVTMTSSDEHISYQVKVTTVAGVDAKASCRAILDAEPKLVSPVLKNPLLEKNGNLSSRQIQNCTNGFNLSLIVRGEKMTVQSADSTLEANCVGNIGANGINLDCDGVDKSRLVLTADANGNATLLETDEGSGGVTKTLSCKFPVLK